MRNGNNAGMTGRNVLAAATIAVVSLAGGAPGAAAAATGLTGIVARGPTTPVCRVGTPCTEPAAKVALVFTRVGGGAPRAATTDRAGRYRVSLVAGVYAVATTRSGVGRGIEPARVRVRARHVDRVDFRIDTGIR